MAATLTYSGGVVTYAGSAGVNSVLNISISGGTYTFNDTAETITVSGFPGTSGGSGTNSATFSTLNNTITAIVVDLNDGTNQLGVKNLSFPLTINVTAGTWSIFLDNSGTTASGGSSSNITADVTISQSGGTITTCFVCSGENSTPGTFSVGVTSSQLTGFLGANNAQTLNYSKSAGTWTLLRCLGIFTGVSTYSWTINNPLCPFTANSFGNNTTHTFTVQKVTNGTCIATGSGQADTYVVGNVNGLADVTSNLQIIAAAGSNTVTLDDSPSSTGRTISCSNNAITGWAPGTINYSNTSGSQVFTLKGGTTHNTWAWTGVGTSCTYNVTLGSGGDTITLSRNTSGTWTATGGTNSFILSTNSTTLTGSVVGSTGNDTLSYAGRTQAITVTVTSDNVDGCSGTATGISGTFSKINTFITPTSGGGTIDFSAIAGATYNGSTTVILPLAGNVTVTGWTVTGIAGNSLAGANYYSSYFNKGYRSAYRLIK